MSKRILAAVDLSTASLDALREAYTRAKSAGAALGICHVLPRHYDLHTRFSDQNREGMLALAEHEASLRDALAESVRSIVGTSDVELFVEQGVDYAEILRRAEAWTADLVVVGSQGRTGLPHLVLGSVAERVVRYAHCPVLVVRGIAEQQCVLVATDLSDPSMPALAAGVTEARRVGGRLVVAQALDLTETAWRAALGTLFGSTTVLPPLEVQQEMRDALTATLAQAIAQLGATGEAVVLDGPPAQAVVRHATEIGAGLLVIGTHGRTGLARIALGSVADQILRTAPCSVLAVRLAN